MSENLIGWRILSTVDQIIPGQYAKTRAQNWVSDYAPEFLMLEMMAQTGGLVIGAQHDFAGNVVFAKVESAEFSSLGAPTSGLIVEAFAREGVGEQGSWIEAHILAEETKVASAKLFLIDAGDLDGSNISVTFHPEFLEYYQVRQKIDRRPKTED
ncbi:MAG TPA: hypothetical protein DIS66_06305 [Candidatus Omnitrophica bacterium]|nr:hypothetical protein [Candidatus Omnitrophota bacterium]